MPVVNLIATTANEIYSVKYENDTVTLVGIYDVPDRVVTNLPKNKFTKWFEEMNGEEFAENEQPDYISDADWKRIVRMKAALDMLPGYYFPNIPALEKLKK